MVPVTTLYASLCALLFLVLTIRVISYRRAASVSVGDAGDRVLLGRIRAQANCAEYLPIGLILLALAELQGAPQTALHLLGLALLAGRIAHAIGFSRTPQIMRLRATGMMLTLGMIAATALGLLGHGLL